jgi:membrane AbrB-like protein
LALGQASIIGTAAAGGGALALVGAPAAWLSGAMAVVAVLSARKTLPRLAPQLRDLAMLIAGVAMGGAVTPEALGSLARYPASLCVLAVCIAAIVGTGTAMLSRFRGWTRLDAALASSPGAMSAVMAAAVETRANVARIAIVQLVRLFALIAILPLMVSLLEGSAAPSSIPGDVASPLDLALMLAGSLVVGLLFERMNLMAPLLLGAMTASGTMHGLGIVHGIAPPVITNAGFVLLGAFIGSRFHGIDFAEIRDQTGPALVSLGQSLVVATLFAALATLSLDIPFAMTLVAFAPGGLEAMTVLSFALGLDPLYVGTHHVVRFIGLAFATALIMKFRPPKTDKSNPQAKDN